MPSGWLPSCCHDKLVPIRTLLLVKPFRASSLRLGLLVCSAALTLLCVRSVSAQDADAAASDDGLPASLSHELHPLVQWSRQQHLTLKSLPKTERKTTLKAQLGRNVRRLQADDESRVIVRVRLDGSASAASVKSSLVALGADVTAEHVALRADGRDGTLIAHLPLDRAEEAAKLPGVHAVVAAHRPRPRAGRVTSQGTTALNSAAVNALGYIGKGITVGVISDSFNVATARSAGGTIRTRATDDVLSGDLPGPGNPDGYSTPVTVLEEGSTDPDYGNADEGRAMLQIIHDVAPGANLAFRTVGDTQEDFAAAIRSLRTNPAANCDVIVDDIGFDDEPFFSDGIVAQAVDDVATSTTLAGRPTAYFSAAGNSGDLSYEGTFDGVSYTEGVASKLGNVRLSSVPSQLTAGGFHNFKGADTGKGTQIVQKVTVSQDDAELNFQWNDPFMGRSPSTGYCLLVFDADGRYLADMSGIDNTFGTGQPIQFAALPLNGDGSDTTYQLVISRRAGGSQEATRLRYIAETNGTVVGKYLHTGQPTLFGHPGARHAEGVGAYDVADLKLPEAYESFGPVTIYFDAQGNRLATPEVRQQPTMAAVDGVDTTFFQPGDLSDTDSDGDGYPNFFGTSAAAPHAAAVAALLLQAGGGKGSLTPAAIHDLMTSTAAEHDLDPASAVASLASADGQYQVTLTARGDDSNNSAFDQKFFTLNFTGPAESTLRKVTIDVSPAGEVFDLSADLGYPFTIGQAVGVPKADVLAAVSEGATADGTGTKLTLTFTKGTFPVGGLLAFGLDRDRADINAAGNSADLLGGATVTAAVFQPDGTKLKLSGTFANQRGHGYTPDVGFGLIDARAAVGKLTGK